MTNTFQTGTRPEISASDRGEPQSGIDRERARLAGMQQTPGMADKRCVDRDDGAEAKAMNRDPITGDPGSHPIGTGIGTTGGAMAGAALGSLSGPAGTALGGVVGAIIGAAAGHVLGEAINPTAEEDHWRDAYSNEPYFNPDLDFSDYAPAFRAGYMYRNAYPERSWPLAEGELKTIWENNGGTSRLCWDEARQAVLAAWRHAER